MKKTMIAAACAIGVLLWSGAGRADISRLPSQVVSGIAALGATLDRPMITKTNELMKGQAPFTPPASVTVAGDVAYGGDPLQKIDIYTPAKAHNLPIAVFFHGGGFVNGDKKDYANVPSYLSQHGMVAVNVNYRLAPKVTWPAASEDGAAVVAFLKKNAAEYGGNPKRIVLIGHSAGANLIATYVLDKRIYPKGGPGIAGAILISLPASRPSGVREADQVYFGGPDVIPSRVPGPFLEKSKLPMMMITAEYDPVMLAPEAYDFAGRMCVRDGKCPPFFYVKGHNHISEIGSIGSADDQVGRAIVDYVRSLH
ncbi:MAG TPA: alpha/beta fold hydrolase [Stellaceae bacterium]|jgi:triacylglycerol lipase|nr:alpha/beta fold hydrolase [Stellaceae bacterium]